MDNSSTICLIRLLKRIDQNRNEDINSVNSAAVEIEELLNSILGSSFCIYSGLSFKNFATFEILFENECIGEIQMYTSITWHTHWYNIPEKFDSNKALEIDTTMKDHDAGELKNIDVFLNELKYKSIPSIKNKRKIV